MTVVRWSPAMSVGVPRLDRDHRVLVGFLNRLAAGKGADRLTLIAEVLRGLIAYTRFHFEREEQVMEACGYPETAAHRREHHDLTREVLDLEKRFADDPDALRIEEMQEFLRDWLNHHILLQDMAYRPYCENNPNAAAAAERFGDFDFASIVLPVSEQELEQAS